jgi:hypothetical protein
MYSAVQPDVLGKARIIAQTALGALAAAKVALAQMQEELAHYPCIYIMATIPLFPRDALLISQSSLIHWPTSFDSSQLSIMASPRSSKKDHRIKPRGVSIKLQKWSLYE